MHNKISWTVKCEDGGKRETRVRVSHHSLKWQFKHSRDAEWDYDSEPTKADWDMLEDVLRRRAARGRGVAAFETVLKIRARDGL